MIRPPALLLSGLLCLAASAQEAKPPAVKTGVDAGLQKRIDVAIAKSRACLERLCLEGNSKAGGSTPESLRQQAKTSREKAEILRKRPQSQKQIERLLKEAETLQKQAEQLERTGAAAKADPHARKLAPLSAFSYGLGEQVLIGLALVQSGSKPSDPLLQQIWERARTSTEWGRYQVYARGVSLMFVDAMMHAPCGEAWPPEDQKAAVQSWVQRAAEELAGGCDGGAWTYLTSPGKGYAAAGRQEIGSPALRKAAVPKGFFDYSNTQYAVLGLKASALCGARIPEAESLWRLVLQHALEGQDPEGPAVRLSVALDREAPEGVDIAGQGWERVETAGESSRGAKARGWGYVSHKLLAGLAKDRPGMPPGREKVSATMTTAGLTALLLSKSELELKPEERALADEGIRDALAWLQGSWSLDCDGYLLYGLERVGVLGNLQRLGGHAWYADGAQVLVDGQSEDGSWSNRYGPGANTAFGLLFLCRGTRAAYARRSYEVVASP